MQNAGLLEFNTLFIWENGANSQHWTYDSTLQAANIHRKPALGHLKTFTTRRAPKCQLVYNPITV